MKLKHYFSILVFIILILCLSACGISKDLKDAIITETKNKIDEQIDKYKNGSQKFSKYLSIDQVSYEIVDVQESTNLPKDYIVTLKFYGTTDKNLDSLEKDLACGDMERLFSDFSFDYKGKKIDVTTVGADKSSNHYIYHHISASINNEEVDPMESEREEIEKHPCAICGKTDGTRQINNSKIGGKWDENWYCDEHYADAWQYYYGD